ncbi:GerAB/ArcD/ProY family transporter [Bacillus luteolus]|uniref:GerAB/ArcD/ProY family transporter n=1 Tax=Litchfieldia luteola TaxID=682179 RepID=A0ABR9QN07_9BACI|nr:GerAB/ArcD/ProY family transporter [Cytobacillus luteolus]MBE4909893.1 GerAB/ArcD/ProY family transporter [Cytobacillus luteolus]MBP1942553.1 spore germination protein (amino acid permease) [Cytobacillus luteolus]
MSIPKNYQVSPYFVFFIIISSQVGVGILSFQRDLAKYAGYDGWISVLLAGGIVQIIMFTMYKLMTTLDGDLLHVNRIIFGKLTGNGISFLFVIYYGTLGFSVLQSYIEIVQVWMFPTLPAWILSLLIMGLVYYIVSGGFRAVVGICFFSTVFPLFSQVTAFSSPSKYYHLDNLLPVMDHSLLEILMGINGTIYTMAGFEVILMIYPFIKKNKPSQKYAHYAIIVTTLLYTWSAIACFLFFSESQLKLQKWPELTITKLIQYPFLERFEYVYICIYMLVILSLLSLLLWCSSRGCKLLFGVKQKYPLLLWIILFVIGSQLLYGSELSVSFKKYVSYLHIVLVYVYIPLLSAIVMIWKRRKIS